MIFLSYEDQIADADDEKMDQVVDKIREGFDLTDIQALKNEENWWAIILEHKDKHYGGPFDGIRFSAITKTNVKTYLPQALTHAPMRILLWMNIFGPTVSIRVNGP